MRCSDLMVYSFHTVSLYPLVSGALQFLNLFGDEGTIKWTVFSEYIELPVTMWHQFIQNFMKCRSVLFNISSHIKAMLAFSSLQTQLLFTKHTVKQEWTVLLGNPLSPPILTPVLSLHCLNRFLSFSEMPGPHTISWY